MLKQDVVTARRVDRRAVDRTAADMLSLMLVRAVGTAVDLPVTDDIVDRTVPVDREGTTVPAVLRAVPGELPLAD